jgi:hypothetical protein
MLTFNQRNILKILWMPAEVLKEDMHRSIMPELSKAFGSLAFSASATAAYWMELAHSLLGDLATCAAIAAAIYSIKASRAAIKKSEYKPKPRPKHEKGTHHPEHRGHHGH